MVTDFTSVIPAFSERWSVWNACEGLFIHVFNKGKTMNIKMKSKLSWMENNICQVYLKYF